MKCTEIVLATVLFLYETVAVSAESFSQLEKQLGEPKDNAEVIKFSQRVENGEVNTNEDIPALFRLTDRFMNAGAKAAQKLTNPNLAKPIITECESRIRECIATANRGKKISAEESVRASKRCMTVLMMVSALGELNSKDSLAFLKKYARPHKPGSGDDSFEDSLSYYASEALDNFNYGISIDSYTVELNSPGLPTKRGLELVELIRKNRDSSKKKVLYAFMSGHNDEAIRKRCAEVLANLIMAQPEGPDLDYIYGYLADERSEQNVRLGVIALRRYFLGREPIINERFVRVLIKLGKDKSESSRSEANRILGEYKVQASSQALEECLMNDEKAGIREVCRKSLFQVTGKVLAKFTKADVDTLEKRYADPAIIYHLSTIKDNPQNKNYELELKHAFDEYKSQIYK